MEVELDNLRKVVVADVVGLGRDTAVDRRRTRKSRLQTCLLY